MLGIFFTVALILFVILFFIVGPFTLAVKILGAIMGGVSRTDQKPVEVYKLLRGDPFWRNVVWKDSIGDAVVSVYPDGRKIISYIRQTWRSRNPPKYPPLGDLLPVMSESCPRCREIEKELEIKPDGRVFLTFCRPELVRHYRIRREVVWNGHWFALKESLADRLGWFLEGAIDFIDKGGGPPYSGEYDENSRYSSDGDPKLF